MHVMKYLTALKGGKSKEEIQLFLKALTCCVSESLKAIDTNMESVTGF